MDYITEVLIRLKKCKICNKKFLDTTYNKNGKYCGTICRNLSDLTKNREYMRKKRHSEYILGKPLNKFSLGTFTEAWLNNHIKKLYHIQNQGKENDGNTKHTPSTQTIKNGKTNRRRILAKMRRTNIQTQIRTIRMVEQ